MLVLVKSILIITILSQCGAPVFAEEMNIPSLGKMIGTKSKPAIHELFGSYKQLNFIESDCSPPNSCELFSGVAPVKYVIVLYDKGNVVLRIELHFIETLSIEMLERQFGPFEKIGLGQCPCCNLSGELIQMYLDANSSFFYYYSQRTRLSFFSEGGRIDNVRFEKRLRFNKMLICKE